MGDLLVKSDFAAWKLREVLEARIRGATANVAIFAADGGSSVGPAARTQPARPAPEP